MVYLLLTSLVPVEPCSDAIDTSAIAHSGSLYLPSIWTQSTLQSDSGEEVQSSRCLTACPAGPNETIILLWQCPHYLSLSFFFCSNCSSKTNARTNFVLQLEHIRVNSIRATIHYTTALFFSVWGLCVLDHRITLTSTHRLQTLFVALWFAHHLHAKQWATEQN